MMKKMLTFLTNHIEKIIVITAIILSIASFLYYFQAGLITAYGDSRGHLNIARRVVDSLTPGAAQLGGYWLPFLHVLMLPTIWNDFFWQTGLSGSIPNMISYVITVLFIYKLAYLMTKNKLSGVIAATVIMFNPNLLYMQATPMTESLFIATLTLFIYYFYRWIVHQQAVHLILAALFAMLSSLNRYEGWGVVIASSVLLLFHWVTNRANKKTESAFFVFSSLAFFGIFLWLLWGATIFHDPLEFLHNDLSAGTQTKLLEQTYDWTGYGNLLEATLTNLYALVHTSGILVSLLALIGVLFYSKKNYKKLYEMRYLFLFLLFAPFLFEVITVYGGKVPVEVPELSKVPSPMNHFNIRYALYSLPALALFITLLTRRKPIQLLFISLIIINYALQYTSQQTMITLHDAGAQAATKTEQESIEWFKQNYTGGIILASTGGQDKRIFRTGIHQKNFITETAYKYWDESLENPARYAKWIILSENNPRDMLYKKINKKRLQEDFHVVKENNDFAIYQKND